MRVNFHCSRLIAPPFRMEKDVERFDFAIKLVSECFPTHTHALDAIICALQAQNSPILEQYVKAEKLAALASRTQKVRHLKALRSISVVYLVDTRFQKAKGGRRAASEAARGTAARSHCSRGLRKHRAVRLQKRRVRMDAKFREN